MYCTGEIVFDLGSLRMLIDVIVLSISLNLKHLRLHMVARGSKHKCAGCGKFSKQPRIDISAENSSRTETIRMHSLQSTTRSSWKSC